MALNSSFVTPGKFEVLGAAAKFTSPTREDAVRSQMSATHDIKSLHSSQISKRLASSQNVTRSRADHASVGSRRDWMPKVDNFAEFAS